MGLFCPVVASHNTNISVPEPLRPCHCPARSRGTRFGVASSLRGIHCWRFLHRFARRLHYLGLGLWSDRHVQFRGSVQVSLSSHFSQHGSVSAQLIAVGCFYNIAVGLIALGSYCPGAPSLCGFVQDSHRLSHI